MVNLLLIDDDEDDIFLFRDVLKEVSFQFEVFYANNGQEAIDHLDLMKPEIPNFIFTDLNMPVMSGWQFLKNIKAHKIFKEIPVIVLSTASDLDTRKQVLALGATDFFTKPATVEGIKNIFEKVVERLQ